MSRLSNHESISPNRAMHFLHLQDIRLSKIKPSRPKHTEIFVHALHSSRCAESITILAEQDSHWKEEEEDNHRMIHPVNHDVDVDVVHGEDGFHGAQEAVHHYHRFLLTSLDLVGHRIDVAGVVGVAGVLDVVGAEAHHIHLASLGQIDNL